MVGNHKDDDNGNYKILYNLYHIANDEDIFWIQGKTKKTHLTILNTTE